MDPHDNSFRKCRKLEGRYANHFGVGYSKNEFIFDFGQSYSDTDQAELFSRIVTSPVYAKDFLKIFEKSVEQFENEYGTIHGE